MNQDSGPSTKEVQLTRVLGTAQGRIVALGDNHGQSPTGQQANVR